jgi:cytochrome b subunit of formate dehydrogenase
MAMAADETRARDKGEVIYRHSRAVRLTHWINAVVLLVMLMSGLQIFNAHPALYLGSKSDFEHPILAMEPMMHDNKIYGVTTLFGTQPACSV